MINYGKLRDRVRIMRKTTEQDANGKPQTGYKETAQIWADVTMISGQRLLASASTHFQSTIRVFTRLNPPLTETDVIDWKPQGQTAARQLKIDSIIHNPDRQYSEILCTSGVQNFIEIGAPVTPPPPPAQNGISPLGRAWHLDHLNRTIDTKTGTEIDPATGWPAASVIAGTAENGVVWYRASGQYLDDATDRPVNPFTGAFTDTITTAPHPSTGHDFGVVTSIPAGVKVGDYGTVVNTSKVWVLGTAGMFYTYGGAANVYINPLNGALLKPPFSATEIRGVTPAGERIEPSTAETGVPAGSRLTLVNGVVAVKQADGSYRAEAGEIVQFPSGDPVQALPPHPATGTNRGVVQAYPEGVKAGDYGFTTDGAKCWVATADGMFYDFAQTATDFIDPVSGKELFRPYRMDQVRAADAQGVILPQSMAEKNIPAGARVTMQNGRVAVKQASGAYLYEVWQNNLHYPYGLNDYEQGTQAKWPSTGHNWGIHWTAAALETGRRGIHVGDYGVCRNGEIWILLNSGLFVKAVNGKPTNTVVEPLEGKELTDPYPAYDASWKQCVRGVSAANSSGWLIDPLIDIAGLNALPDGAQGTTSDVRPWKKQGGSFIYNDFGSVIRDISVLGEL